LNPTGGHGGFGEGDTEIFLRGLGFGFGFGLALMETFVVGFEEALKVGLELALAVALTVGVGDGFFVAATAELPENAKASARKSESFFNRAPT
jgi:hypothetical protein